MPNGGNATASSSINNNNTTTATTNTSRKSQVVGSSNNKNNHGSSIKTLVPATSSASVATTNITASNNPKNFKQQQQQQINGHQQPHHSHQQPQQQKRLSILSTTMPKHANHHHHHPHQMSQLYPDNEALYYQQHSTSRSAVVAPQLSYTLQSGKTISSSLASRPQTSQAFYHNSLKTRDLKALKLSLTSKNCNPDDDSDDILSDDRGDEDGDYYMPSSLEILSIQKALENIDQVSDHIKAPNETTTTINGSDSDTTNDDVVGNVKASKDLESQENATNNLFKLQQQQQKQHNEQDEQTTTNRLWYH
ncbi:uncharacterized protein LOC142223628 [Haematobia irritans]|uniref:uncharacterized protein LOC142223628 n=1 Tax=Haematobia irritans TaxID=7368 RepID=UPI003F4FF192